MVWGKMEKKIAIKERDELVYKLRKKGDTFRHIASLLNISGTRVTQIYSRAKEKKEDFKTWPPLKQMLSKRPQTALIIYFGSASILEDPQRIAELGRTNISRIKNIGLKSIYEIASALHNLGSIESIDVWLNQT